jgi:hypothetical protein
MKEQIETVVPRRKFVARESDEARKTATWHSCKPLAVSLEKKPNNTTYYGIRHIKDSFSKTFMDS